MIQRFTYISAMLLVFVLGCKSGESGPAAKVKRYPYERVHIQYEVSGGIRGKEDVFIADYGRLEARYSNMEVFKPMGVMPARTIFISKGADLYRVDIQSRDGDHTIIAELDSVYKGLVPVRSPQELSEYALRQSGLIHKGKDTAAGRICDKWTSPDGMMSLWIANTILMRKVSPDHEGIIIDQIAIVVDTNWVVDSMAFALPAGINFKEAKQGAQ